MNTRGRAPGAEHRSRLAEALAAIAIHEDGSFSWFGERFPGGAEPTLIPSVQRRLYLDYYTQGAAGPARDTRLTPAGQRDDLLPALRAVNGAVAARDPGWTVVGADGDLEIERDGLRLWVRPDDLEGGRQFAPGDVRALLLPNELSARSPGHYVALGETPLPRGDACARVYWNLDPGGAVALTGHLLRAMNSAGLPFTFKVLCDSTTFGRADAGVLYIRRADRRRALSCAGDVARAGAEHLRPAVPALTLPLAPGVAFAEDPGAGESFGAKRCRLIAEGLVQAWSQGAGSDAERLDVVVAHLASAGVSLDAPHREGGDGPDPRPFARVRSAPRITRRDPLVAAAEIGGGICAAAVWHGDRCSWIAPAPDERPTPQPRTLLRPLPRGFYRGTAGVGLFLAELFSVTGDSAFRETALGALRHALGPGRDDRLAGLYSGTAGIAYAAGRGGALLGAEEIVAGARRLLRYAPASTTSNDVMDGVAGTALGALAAGVAGVPGGTERLHGLADELLARARPRVEGLSWDTPAVVQSIDDLLGMAHGASGVGLALAALADRLGRADLAEASRDAARYERTHIDRPSGAWPDLRGRSRGGADGSSLTMAWCHGTPGVALARLRAGTILHDAPLLGEARAGLTQTAAAVRRTIGVVGADHCLCHGLAGNADILLEGARSLPDAPAEWLALAREVGEAGDASYPGRGRPWPLGPLGGSPALMLGEAGIGIFLLRLADPAVPSVLAIDGGSRAIPDSLKEMTDALAAR